MRVFTSVGVFSKNQPFKLSDHDNASPSVFALPLRPEKFIDFFLCFVVRVVLERTIKLKSDHRMREHT